MKRTIINGLIVGLSTGLLAACGGGNTESSGNQQLATTAACYAAWNSATAYTGGQTASYSGVNYKANWWTQGENPSTHNGGAGSGQPWTSQGACGSTPTPTPTPAPTPTPTPTPTPAPTPTPTPAPTPTPTPTPTGSTVFSAYKDVTVSADWNTDTMRTAVTGSTVPVTQAMSAKNSTLTWAFATGECGSENWAGMAPGTFGPANVSLFTGAGKKYIVSTGGAAGSFTCGSDSGFTTFVNRYKSANMIGVDFDIEVGQTQAAIDSMVTRAKNWGGRASFTIATLAQNNGASSSAKDLGSSSPDSLNSTGAMVVNSVKSHGLTNYTINLMTMDYGTGSGVCVMNGSTCQMGQSAIQAAMNLHGHYGIPYNHIEITPMNGTNDVAANVFSLADAATVGSWSKANGIAGVHYWSMDRDSGLSYTNQFISSLGL